MKGKLVFLILIIVGAGAAWYFYSSSSRGLETPTVELIDGMIEDVSRTGASLGIRLQVYNPNDVPLPLPSTEFDIYLNGGYLGEGVSEAKKIEADAYRIITVTTSFLYRDLTKGALALLNEGGVANVEVSGEAKVSVLGHDLIIPFDVEETIDLKAEIESQTNMTEPSLPNLNVSVPNIGPDDEVESDEEPEVETETDEESEDEVKPEPELESAFDFSVFVSPSSRTISKRQSTTYEVTIKLISGTTEKAYLSAVGLPSATKTFSVNSGNPPFTSTLTVDTTLATIKGTHNIIIYATGLSETIHKVTVEITIK